MTRELLAIGAVTLLAAGCASRVSMRQLQEELGDLRAEVRAEVTELRNSHELTAREVARAIVAELQPTLREQAAEVARLRARLDAADKEAREAKTPVMPEASATALAPSAAPVPLALATAPPAQRPASAAALARSAAPMPPALASAPPAQRSGELDLDEAGRVYEAAVATFRAKEHGQAVLDFLDFIATYPTHPLAASAQYWIGEAYYVQRDYHHALEEFRRVVEMAPSSRSAPDALLRIGLAYTNLRDNSRAQMVWQRVLREYPASEAAGKARALLRQHAARRP